MFDDLVSFIREQYGTNSPVPLHAPVFAGNEKEYVNQCIETTFVSSVGTFVDEFEKSLASYVGSRHAVAVVNGTQALFVALKISGAGPDTEVLTQSLTFVATANAISYSGAHPVFLDVDRSTMGLSADALKHFLATHARNQNGTTINKKTGRRIAACVPMHTCGHACRIEDISEVCRDYNIPLVEDAAESLGTSYNGRHTGAFGALGIFSFNGNKIVTTGGGGMIVTDDPELASRAKHLTTTAKVPHPWEFIHDEIGFNYRLPNINAALGVAQIERLPSMLEFKRNLAEKYRQFFESTEYQFMEEPPGSKSNYWLNAVLAKDQSQRDALLNHLSENGIMARPLWRPMHLLPIYAGCFCGSMDATEELYQRAVNLPSGVHL